MYYEERIVNGILCCRRTPKGDFKPLSAKELTNRILELKKVLSEIK